MNKLVENFLDFLEVTDFSQEKKTLAELGIKYTRTQYNAYIKKCEKNNDVRLSFSKTQDDILRPLKNKTNQMPVKKGFGFIEAAMATAKPDILKELNESYKIIAEDQGMSKYPVAYDVVCKSLEYKGVRQTTFDISASSKAFSLS